MKNYTVRAVAEASLALGKAKYGEDYRHVYGFGELLELAEQIVDNPFEPQTAVNKAYHKISNKLSNLGYRLEVVEENS